MKTILLLTLLALSSTAQARLGETVAECVKRYGNPTSHNEETGLFSCTKDSMFITLRFLNGRCSQIGFARVSATNPRAVEPLSAEEIQALLEVSGTSWREIPSFGNKRWQTSDGTRFAQYSPGDFFLLMMTAEQAEADAASRAAAAKKKLQGF